MLHSLGGISEATVINHPWQTGISRAAFAHGRLIGAFECEPLTGSHASGTVVPAALTVSQRERLDGLMIRKLSPCSVGAITSRRPLVETPKVTKENRCLCDVSYLRDIGVPSPSRGGGRRNPPCQTAWRNNTAPCRGCRIAPPPVPLRKGF